MKRKKIEIQKEKKIRRSTLRDVILGGQDGLVNVLGLSLGLIAAGSGSRLVLVAGLASGISEAISMGAVAYTSSLAEKDFYEKTKEIVHSEIRDIPVVEEDIIYEIFEKKGFSGDTLSAIVAQVCSDKKLWVDTLLKEDLEIHKVNTRGLFTSSFIVGISALVGSLIPLFPFMILNRTDGLIGAVVVSAIVLFGVGAYKAYSLVGNWWKSGLQMLLIGIACAIVGLIVGMVLKIN